MNGQRRGRRKCPCVGRGAGDGGSVSEWTGMAMGRGDVGVENGGEGGAVEALGHARHKALAVTVIKELFVYEGLHFVQPWNLYSIEIKACLQQS